MDLVLLSLWHRPQGGSTTSYSRVASPASWWSLCSLRGEALHAALPTALSPEFGPEAIVKSQLDALRRCVCARGVRPHRSCCRTHGIVGNSFS